MKLSQQELSEFPFFDFHQSNHSSPNTNLLLSLDDFLDVDGSMLPPLRAPPRLPPPTPHDLLAVTHAKLTADLTAINFKLEYSQAGLKAATAEWEKVNNAAQLCSSLRVKTAKLVAEKVGWKYQLIEVEESLCNIREQGVMDKEADMEEAQLKIKKWLLDGLIEKAPEALRSVEMLVGPAVSFFRGVRMGCDC
jgi:hypothetical protein